MAIERQAVQGLAPVQRLGGPQASMLQSRSFSGGPDVSTQPSLLADIMSVVGNSATIATSVMNNIVEEDKVRQYDRNLQGLMPTEDATVGGRRAHMLVSMQNRANEVTVRLTDDAKRFQGTDEEWENHVIQSQRTVREEMALNYPELAGDKDTAKMVTTTFLEQQPKVFAARMGSKLALESQKRTEAIQSRVLSMTEGLQGGALVGMLHNLQRDAISMQITKPEFEELVVGMALERAAAGDSSFIEATKGIKDGNGVSLFARNGKLLTAEIQADRMHSSLNQVELFEKKDGAMTALAAGEISWEEFLQVADNQNAATGGTAWSDSELMTLKAKRSKAAAEEAKMEALLARGEGASPLGLQDVSAEERKDYAEALRATSTELAQREIDATGATGEAAEAIRGKYEQLRLMKMGQNVIQDPVAKERFDSLMMMSAENLRDMNEEPEAMQTLLRTRDSLPVSSRRAVLGDKEYAFTENYDRALRMGRTSGQAIEFAQNASRGERIPSGVLKAMNKAVEDVVGEVAGGSWMTRGDNMSDLGRDLMHQEAQQIATAMKVAGHNDETIKRDLREFLSGEYTQLAEGFFTQGVLVKGVQSTSELGRVMGINPNDAAAAMSQYITNNEQVLLDNAVGYERKDLYFDIDQKKGMFVIRAGSARTPVTVAAPLDSIDGNALLEQKLKEEIKARDEAKAGFEAEMMRRGSWGMSPSTVRPTAEQTVPPTAQAVGRRGIADFLMSPAFASGHNLPGNFEFAHSKKSQDFYTYLAKQENSINAGFNRQAGTYEPYDSDDKTPGANTIGFGHKITEEEKRNGYIVIDGNKVPYKPGASKLTADMAMKLLEQDAKNHIPSTSGWSVPFNMMHPGVQRGLQDLGYNLGKQGISRVPKADAAFKSGNFTDGFIYMLGTASENGGRSTGLLARRAESYNMAIGAAGLPKIEKVEANADGSMRVKFNGKMSEAFVGKDIYDKIGEDGWMTVYRSKKGALHPRSRPGVISLN